MTKRKLTGILSDEKGATLVWCSILMVVLFGFSSLVIDVGFINSLKADMQKAADSAALAGAQQLPNESMAQAYAKYLTAKNDFTDGVDTVVVTCVRNPTGNNPGWYQVQIEKKINHFFAPILGHKDGIVRATATASYFTALDIDINGGGEYGVNGIMTLGVFGPHAPYSYGDPFSTRWRNNGAENPEYKEEGYNFKLEVPANYQSINGTNILKVELFDPDTWNYGNAADAGPDAVDEIRNPTNHVPRPDSIYTTTRFQLFAPSSSPGNYDDDILIAEAIYGPGDTLSDMQWVSPDGWEININEWGVGDYRINVKTLDGSSENGFNLRAGPPLADGESFNSNNGTRITGTGSLPINFMVGGTVHIELGEVPPEAGGFNVYVANFDTDVSSKDILFYDELGNSWPGTLSADGTWETDVIDIPTGYPGSKLYARYRAGRLDTSVWQMYFDGHVPGSPSILKLVD